MLSFNRLPAIAICAAVSVLAACNGATYQPFRSPRLLGNTVASGTEVLYISIGPSVRLVSYPADNYLGTIKNVREPLGLCSDASGNVFVTGGGDESIYEYAHASTQSVAHIKDPNEKPNGCSVDPLTGNLAVANYCQRRDGTCIGIGNVVIYKGATRRPKSYALSGTLTNPLFCGYDNSGDLFVVGSDGTSTFTLAELSKGSRDLRKVKLHETLGTPGNVQWDGSYVTVGDATTNEIHRFTVANYRGIEAGPVQVDGVTHLGQTWILDGKLFIPNRRAHVGSVLTANYPQGGQTVKAVKNLRPPFGLTVSVVP